MSHLDLVLREAAREHGCGALRVSDALLVVTRSRGFCGGKFRGLRLVGRAVVLSWQAPCALPESRAAAGDGQS